MRNILHTLQVVFTRSNLYHSILILAILALLHTGVSFAAPATGNPSANTTDPTPTHEFLLDTVWNKYIQELNDTITRLTADKDNLQNKIKALRNDLSIWENDYQNLLSLYQLSRNDPIIQHTIIQELGSLQQACTPTIKLLEKEITDVVQALDNFSIMQKKMESQLSKNKEDPLNNNLQQHLASLKTNMQQLSGLQNRLSTLLSQMQEFSAKITQTTQEIYQQLPALWQNFYFSQSSSLFDLNLLQHIPDLVGTWVTNLTNDLYAQTAYVDKLSGMLTRFIFVLLPLLILSYFIGKIQLVTGEYAHQHNRRISRFCLPLMSVGLSLYFAAWLQGTDFYAPLALIGHLCWLWGLVVLAWELRCLILDIPLEISPFSKPLLACLTGILLLSLAPPAVILAILWITLMLPITAIDYWHKNRRALPRLERFTLKMTSPMALLSLTIAAFGWVYLAIPLFLFYIAFLVSIQLGNAMTKILAIQRENAVRQGIDAIVNAVRITLGTPFAWIFAVVSLFPWLTVMPGSLELLKKLSGVTLVVGSFSLNFVRLFSIIVIYYVTHASIIIGKSLFQQVTKHRTLQERNMLAPLQTSIIYIGWSIFALVSLNILGMDLTSLSLIAGGLSVGLGFGLQTIFNNFISGILLIFSRSLVEGDVIQLGETWGTVKKIHIRSTKVETFDSAIIFVPNSEFVSQQLVNWTNKNRHIRRDITIRVAYGSDRVLVEQILLEAAKANPKIMGYPVPIVLLQKFAPTSLEFVLRVWVKDIDDSIIGPSELRKTIDDKFKEHKIAMPVASFEFPTPAA